MKNLRIRTRVVAALVAVALLLAMQVVPAGAAEPKERPARTDVALMTGSRVRSSRVDLMRQFTLPAVDRQSHAELSALAADDNIPGVAIMDASELPWPEVVGSLDATSDAWDVYSVTAYPGDQISFFADPDPEAPYGDSTLDVDVYLWDATADSVFDDPVVGGDSDETTGAPAWVCYTVPEGAPSATYYVGMHAKAGANAVVADWGVTSRSDGNIPGVTLPPSGFSDSVISDGDMDDVFAIHLGEGETLTLVTYVDSGSTPWVGLFPPGTDDVWGTTDEVAIASGSDPTLTYAPGPGAGGVYYIDVLAAGGATGYHIDWQVTGVNVPGKPMPGSGTTVAFQPGANVRYVDLRAGETLSISVPDPDNDFRLYLYAPDSTDRTDTPIRMGATGANPKALSYTVPAGAGGRYYVNLDNQGGAPLNRVVIWSTKTGPARLAGAGRYETAVLASKRDFPDGADTVVIASGEGFADALAAAGLAGAYDAPILLVQTGAVPSAVAAEIVRLGATRCFIIGGTAVVTDAVRNAIDGLPGMSTPRRIAGPNRYETSALVADEITTKDGWVDWPRVTFDGSRWLNWFDVVTGPPGSGYGVAAVARGDNFADALALAPIAWGAKMPILLTNSAYLPAPTDARLPGGTVSLEIENLVFAGGTSAISEGVYNYVVTDIGLKGRRLAGANRYETAALIADWSAGSPWLSYEAVGLATGANFPDALGGGAAIAKAGGVLLMTEPTRFTSVTQTKLVAHKAQTAEVQVFGGTGAVNATVFNQVKALY